MTAHLPAQITVSPQPPGGRRATGTAADAVGGQPAAYASLLRRDSTLRRIAGEHGRPDPFGWDVGGRTGTSNFAALLLHIAGQQISTAVALVLFDRLRAAAGGIPDPESVVSLGPDRVRALGFSRAKASSMLNLAELQIEGTVDVDGMGCLDDEQAIASLTVVRGIGRWSAEMFLIHQLRRPDVLPAGDLGVRRAVEKEWGMPEIPSEAEVRAMGRAWAPNRSYAAALLWASLRPAARPTT